jgi:hypothetical protein
MRLVHAAAAVTAAASFAAAGLAVTDTIKLPWAG